MIKNMNINRCLQRWPQLKREIREKSSDKREMQQGRVKAGSHKYTTTTTTVRPMSKCIKNLKLKLN